MKRLSANQIGKMIGLSAREVNFRLAELGYLAGEPGNWKLTAEGSKHGGPVYRDNGYGGYAARAWGVFDLGCRRGLPVGGP